MFFNSQDYVRANYMINATGSTAIDTSKISGVGLGYRDLHAQDILSSKPDIAWFEVISDNYLAPGGLALENLEKLRSLYPLSMHSVGLSLGSMDALDFDYLRRLKSLYDRFQPDLISDHLCWTSAHGHHFHELLPLPYTQKTALYVAERIKVCQDFLNRQMQIENVTSYLRFSQAEMSEAEFVNLVANLADCKILLDLNNIYISAFNHGYDWQQYVSHIDSKRISEFHLAGFESRNGYLADTHSRIVDPAVWQLLDSAFQLCGKKPTLIEWDNDLPDFEVLMSQAIIAQDYYKATHEISSAA